MLIQSPETEYAKERVKFEAQNSDLGIAQRPYIYREYPTSMYLAGIPAGHVGAPRIIDEKHDCDETMAENLASRGWRKKPTDALEVYSASKLEEAKLAAEIEYEVRHKLSPNAIAEVRAAQDETEGHLAVVPETAIRRRITKARRRNAQE